MVSGKKHAEDRVDHALRPRRLAEMTGQDRVVENLRILIEAAKARKEAVDHVLLYGPPGLGKTTFAHVIANEMEVNIRITAGPSIERAGDLAAILTHLREGDILFIDEIHRLGRAVEEVLYPAMEDFALDIVIGKGPSAKNVRLNLPRFTVIGATTRLALLTAPLRARFGAVYRLDFYSLPAMIEIVQRAARLLKVPIEEDGIHEIARRARGTPRVALRLLKRVRDYAQVRADGVITGRVSRSKRSICWRSTRSAWTTLTAACCAPSSRSSRAGRWVWKPSPPRSAKNPIPSWMSTSRICSSSAFWSARRAGAWRPGWPTSISDLPR